MANWFNAVVDFFIGNISPGQARKKLNATAITLTCSLGVWPNEIVTADTPAGYILIGHGHSSVSGCRYNK